MLKLNIKINKPKNNTGTVSQTVTGLIIWETTNLEWDTNKQLIWN